MSLIKAIRAQLGLSNTAANNFTLDASADNGTMKLARGNAGATTQDILTVDSSGVVAAPQGSYGGLRLATAQASTSGTVIDFTGIPSWAKRITVMLNGVSTNGTSNIQVQLGDSGGIENTGYTSVIFATTTAPLVAATSITSGFAASSSVNAATSVTGTVVITNITGNTWVHTTSAVRSDNAICFSGNGTKTLSDTLTQIRITTVNGTDTFDAGTINIMYEG